MNSNSPNPNATHAYRRRFAREKLERLGVETDRTHAFPRAAVDELGRLGMLGVFIPEEYGAPASITSPMRW